jgi:hypothetical protein
MKRLVIVILFASAIAIAEKNPYDANVENTTMLNPACPVTLTGLYFGTPRKTGADVSVHFVNQTDKDVIALKFGLVGFDATWDTNSFPDQYAIPVRLKPHHEAKPIFRVAMPNFKLETSGGAEVYLTKVVFRDGSIWKDDGARSCSLSVKGVAKPTRRSDDD